MMQTEHATRTNSKYIADETKKEQQTLYLQISRKFQCTLAHFSLYLTLIYAQDGIIKGCATFRQIGILLQTLQHFPNEFMLSLIQHLLQ